MELYGAKPYTILERNGVKIGIYGVLGQEAEDFAPESGIDISPLSICLLTFSNEALPTLLRNSRRIQYTYLLL